MVNRLNTLLFGAMLSTLFSAQLMAQSVPPEKHYRQAAWAFYNDAPAEALQSLQLSQQQDARSMLMQAGLYLQLGMPQHAAGLLKPLVDQGQQQLPRNLLNIALLQFARYQLELGDKLAARSYLAAVNLSADDPWLGQQQLLQQLVQWPEIALPVTPEFAALKFHPQMPYIVSNQALALALRNQPKQAQLWLSQLQQQIKKPDAPGFWQALFTGQWQQLYQVEGYDFNNEEYIALQDYLQLLQAQLYIEQQDFAAADAVLSDFAANSVLSPAALALYSHILTEQRHIPTLLAVLQQQINLQPFSLTAWQAATRLGEQLERTHAEQDALAAYRWADQYYQQQLQQIEQQAVPLDVGKLMQGLSAWQKLQISQHDNLYRLQQDILTLQQQLAGAPERQQRLQQLAVVNRYKQQQQQRLLQQQLPLLEQRRAKLVQQSQQLLQRISAAQAEPLSLLLSDGEQFTQLGAVQSAKDRLARIKQLNSDFDDSAYQLRLKRLSGLLQWQYYDDSASRELSLMRAKAALSEALLETDTRLTGLQTQQLSAERLVKQADKLALLNSHQQQLNLRLLSLQQQRVALLNQQLQQRRQQDIAVIRDLQRHNKQALARVMERVLRAQPLTQEVAGE